MVRSLDELREFEKFRDEVLPALQVDLRKGLTAKQLRSKYATILTARMISIAVAEMDSGKATTAIKDILDRDEGKAVEQKITRHKFENLSDEQLDAIILSEADDLEREMKN